MIGFQDKAQKLFDVQTAGKASLSEVRELSFAQCCISPHLLQTKFSQLTNLSRITLVAMKPSLNDDSFKAILSALPETAKQNTLRAIDVCDNKQLSVFPRSSSSTSSFPKLVRLVMANNKVGSLESIFGESTAEKAFPALRTLDVEFNVLSNDLAKTAFELCPSLVVVNGKNKKGEDWHDASDDEQADDDDTENEGNGDVEAFADQDGDDTEEFLNNYNSNESPARRHRAE